MSFGRTCRTCERSLPVTRFWKQAGRADGLQSECKDCMRQRTTAYHRANRATLRPRNNAVIQKRRQRDPIRALLSFAKARARAAGIEFSITASDLTFPERCPVLGISLSFGLGRGRGQSLVERDQRYSIDRIDNCRGYVPGNVIVVSYRANRIKSDATAAELMAVARFYDQLDTQEAGQADVSAVQPSAPEEDRALLVSVGG